MSSFPGRPAAEASAHDERHGPARTAVRVAATAVPCVLIALLGVAAATHGTGELRLPAAGTTTLLDAVVFAALAVHLGEAAGGRLVRDPVRSPAGSRPGAAADLPERDARAPAPGLPRPVPRAFAVVASLAGAGAAAGLLVLLWAAGGLDPAAVYGTADGRLLLVMANGFLLAAGCAALTRPGWALVPLAAVICAEAVRARPDQITPLAGAALTAVHLAAASLWTGGLLYVLRVVRLSRTDRTGTMALLARHGRHAGLLLAVLAATGAASALRELPAEVAFTSAYGRVLLFKLALVTVAGACGLAARNRLRRAGRPGPGSHALMAVLLCVVLVSAVLTVVPDPNWLALRRH